MRKAMTRHAILRALSSEELEHAQDTMQQYELEQGEVIYETGFPGSFFYVLTHGEAQVESNGVILKTVHPGESFGDPALLLCSPRTASAHSTQRVTLWAMTTDVFHHCIDQVKSIKIDSITLFLQSTSYLSTLREKSHQHFLRFCVYEQIVSGERILAQGSFGCLLYFVMSGQVAVLQNGREIRRLGPGEFFGEQAILYNTFRTADVIALTDCELLNLNKHYIQLVFDTSLNAFIYTHSLRIVLENSRLFGSMNAAQREELISRVNVTTFAYDEVVVSAGQMYAEAVWVVLKGSLAVREPSGLSRKMTDQFELLNEDLGRGQGGHFGWDIVADEDEVAVVEIPRHFIESIAPMALQKDTDDINITELMEVGLMRSLAVNRLAAFAKYARKIRLSSSQEIPSHLLSSSLCILFSGQTSTDAAGPCLLPVSQAPITCVSDCVLWCLHRTYWRPVFVTLSIKAIYHMLTNATPKVRLRDSTPLARVTKLAGGTLFVASESPESLLYVKRVSRQKATKQLLFRRLLREREILQSVTHPSILRLLSSNRDQKYMYLVLEYSPGQILSEILFKKGRLGEEDASVLFAMAVQMLDSLHSSDILHRDFTPDSMLLDEKGCLRLIDCSNGVPVEGNNHSLVGHPHYMAPEKVKHKAYGKEADIWSLGVLLFRLLYGRLPYGDVEEDPYIIYTEIVRGQPQFVPGVEVSAAAFTLLNRLLSMNPSQRGSISAVKMDPWLAHISWVSDT